MGIYLNPGSEMFEQSLHSEIYVDKTAMIEQTNRFFKSQQKYLCVSRPRRFGKTMAADMLCAYYDRTVDGAAIFQGLVIEQAESFAKYRNTCDVIRLNMQEFLSETSNMEERLAFLQEALLWELLQEYPDLAYFRKSSLRHVMETIHRNSRRFFVIVIDEWDGIFREYPHDTAAQRQYLDFLRDWLKDKAYIGLAYMTGILPIKKYGTHSALNMFLEFSMADPRHFAPFVGFLEHEVKALCTRYAMDFAECRAWYDGYHFAECGAVYSPKSVVEAMLSKAYGSYWNRTETYEALKIYIDLNREGLRDAIVNMMGGGRQRIATGNFANDMTTFTSADDVLTLLVHLGYLGYDKTREEVFVPNNEILDEYVNATKQGEAWDVVRRALQASDALMAAIAAKDAPAVAQAVEQAHMETSHLQYNDENALAYTLSLALYSARRFYQFVREMPAGKGFADLLLLPRPMYAERAAIVVELKWAKSAETALRQIKEKKYGEALADYTGRLLLVGISYDKKTREHSAVIEEIEKKEEAPGLVKAGGF